MGKGSSNSSSSHTATTTTTNTKNLNLQGVQGTQVFSDGQVSVTDNGAIAGSLSIGKDAVSAVTQISQAFLNAQKQTNDKTLALTTSIAQGAGQIANNATKNQSTETIKTLIKYGSGAAIAVAGAYIFTKGK